MRRVFVDLGVNWCNTVRIFEDLDPVHRGEYSVFGFEASPLIQPFAESYFKWLNGERLDMPVSCVPRSGSSSHLRKYAPFYGCPTLNLARMHSCMWAKLDRHLAALRPDPRLNISSLVTDRLRPAQHCENWPSERPRFHFIPAAAGSAEDGAWLAFWGPPNQLIRGGSIPDYALGRSSASSKYDFVVPVVDVAEWLGSSFTLQVAPPLCYACADRPPRHVTEVP